MNLHESEFENTLRTLRPAAPSLELEARIAHGLAVRERTLTVNAATTAVLERRKDQTGNFRGLLRGLGWATAGAVAALALFQHSTFAPRQTPPPLATTAPSAFLQSIESSAELLAASDEGLRYDLENSPVRQVRYSLLERHAWVDPTTGARLEFAVPREDVQLIPVAFQ